MRVPSLKDVTLATGIAIAGGASVPACSSKPKTYSIDISVRDCTELREKTDLWWNEVVGGHRNGIRQACQELIFRDKEDEAEKTGVFTLSN